MNAGGDRVRWIDVPPERLATWLAGFAERHGGFAAGHGATGCEPGAEVVTFRAADGAVAACHVPFPPLAEDEHGGTQRPAAAGRAAPQGTAAACCADRITAHALAGRTVGVLLVRLGGYAAGVFTGPGPTLTASKVGARLVHGRSAAGGTSQQRFARRRQKQAGQALAAAADTAAAVFGPFTGRLDAVVLGGDRRAVAALRSDPRLRPFLDVAVQRFLTVPDPRLAVLRGTPRLFRAVRVRLAEPVTSRPPRRGPGSSGG